ncbi:sugar MFS transporter [Vibrio aestuarianus subsp. cardii]|uniref:sugar MFS transporter n=2 Tax=Vibrio aestuarianus TaxID=28171 RepID=UPI001559E6CB|nr:sugar MFS transporter [Vibrio aestuarianus]NGZ68597.1 sugar MFS transporter [Vibrio aestuarianus subsp. cardii]
MNQNDYIGKTLKPWPILVDHYTYPIFLISLFILASGLTLLQVSANPYVNLLGTPETAAKRLNLTQAFNSLGTAIGPMVGGMFILSTVVLTSEEKSALSPSELQAHLVNEASSVQIPYIVLTVALVLLAVVILMCKLPKLTSDKLEADTLLQGKLTQHKHLMFGVIGIFMYVGAEVSIGSFLINFMENPAIANLSALEASKHLALYWGGAMIGRFVGSYVMTWIRPNKLLAFNAIIIISLIIVAMMIQGSIGMWALLAIGLFNSIMFPTIFSLSLEKLGGLTGKASGLLCMGIVGGAIVPMVQASFADSYTLIGSFAIPAICYAYIAWFGLSGFRPAQSNKYQTVYS